MRKIIGIISTLLLLVVPAVFQAQAEDISEPNYTKLREIDKGTFNEYRYRITGEYFKLREKFEISGTVDKNIANQIFLYAREGYKYLPDNLRNQNYYNNLVTALKRGIKYPDNEASYTEIVKAVEKYLDDVDIQTITGSVEVTPTSGNAPLTVTLRGRVKDPTGSVIPTFNYIWWIDDGGERKIIGRKQSITYTFRDEGNFSVFLDVVSAHKNEEGFTDVLPFRSRGDIEVKEKVASLIIKVNDSYLRNNSELKFDPTEASYGLIFDATSSTPTSGTDFIRTEWDFGNGVERKYDGEPRIERVVYAKEGDYTVTLRLKTNELRQVERKFRVAVHKPIATIRASREEGFMGDKFTFSAESGGNDENLSYSWEIVDIDRGEVIFTKSGNLFTYAFTKKGEYSIKLNVLEPSGDRDQDDFTVYINSRAPVADFTYKIPKYSKPNELLLDASRSFDPDFSDDGKLEYIWTIDGERVKLERPNANGSVGYYTFDSVGDHSVSLEVTDPDSISAVKSDKVQVTSVLSVDFNTFPRVIARDGSIRFVADSPNARFYEWDFGDGESEAGNSATMTHKYTKSGLFTVSLRVRDAEDTTNSFEKTVYVAESNSPVAVIDLDLGNANEPPLVPKSCEGQSAYVVSRVDSIRFSGLESINIDGENNNLEYSWKLGNNTYFTSSNFNYTFDDLGCIPVKLTVKSKDNGATHVRQVWIKVENKLPELTSLTIDVQDPETDPVIVNVTALGAKDRDGIIQSYLWYYYTDIDPEPQDFRVTNKPGTTFVLPKVTGNYYFVVVLKDNNEARVTSEEVTGSKFFTTLAGDNINTPLIDFRVSDSSVSIGEEVEFNVIAKNILGQDISKAATYFWDFNGDGFYDVETSTPQAKYSYPQSGSYFAKVKVKHKGFSNTRNLTVDVSNKLVANFDVVSIGNTYVFANTSLGTFDQASWDLGDGTEVKDAESFTHTYEDAEGTHTVTLRISEGTKVKDIEKKVLRNVKNKLRVNKTGITAFTLPDYEGEGVITLEDANTPVYVYLGDSVETDVKYAIDYDVAIDSDLNGGKDDDIDNTGKKSLSDGSPQRIVLNDMREQVIRLMLIDGEDTVIDSFDITIVKNYIEEATIDMSTIRFNGVTDSERAKIETLKNMVTALPSEHKLKAMMYLSQLQDEWFDETQKTRVIIEFEGYVDSTGVSNAEDFIELLESLLVEGQADQSDKNIAYNALKALVPADIACDFDGEYADCKTYMISVLDTIYASTSVDDRRLLGTELLDVIKDDTSMTDKQKIDFKAVLKLLVYAGVDNIPDDEKEEVVQETDTTGEESSSGGVLQTIGFWLLVLIGVFGGILALYWIYYKVKGKDGESLTDFIASETGNTEDVLGGMNTDEETSIPEATLPKEDKSMFFETKNEEKTIEEVPENKQDISDEDLDAVTRIEDSSVPDWLKNSVTTSTAKATPKSEPKDEAVVVPREKQQEAPKEVKKDTNNDVPDWLKGGFDIDKKTSESTQTNMASEKIERVKDDNSQKNIPTPSDEKIPSWLQGAAMSKGEEKPEAVVKDVEAQEVVTPEAKKEAVKESRSSSHDDVPDWLKGSFDPEPLKTEDKKEAAEKDDRVSEEPEKKEEVPAWLQGAAMSKGEEKPEAVVKDVEAQEVVTPEAKKEEVKETTSSSHDDVPDWLKGSFDPEPQEETKKDAPGSVDTEGATEIVNEDVEGESNATMTSSTDGVSEEAPKKKTRRRRRGGAKKTSDDTPKPSEEKKDDTVIDKKPDEGAAKKNDKQSDTGTKEELWDDGMKVPDWLKPDGGDDK